MALRFCVRACMVRTSRHVRLVREVISTYTAHHSGIVIAADRCREQMRLPVDQIDSCRY